jgi:hypothetical protein
MPEPIKFSIDVTKVDKRALFEGKNGAKYLNCVMWPSENDQYGNDYRINQDLPKDMRDAGEKGKILGNGKVLNFGKPQQQQPRGNKYTPPPQEEPQGDDDSIPF